MSYAAGYHQGWGTSLGWVSGQVPVLLSSSSVFPEPTAAAFEVAAALGYDGVEVMVWTDPVSRDADALRGLHEHYKIPVLSVHAPCLLVTQRVWSPDPWQRLARSVALAETLGAPTVVVHPPFSWQREYARTFAAGLGRLSAEHSAVRIAVENMFPVRMAGRQFVPYMPGWDPTEAGYDAYTLDLSHCAVSRSDALAMADRMGDRLAHLHLGDGTGESRDEHLVPGRGRQPCAEMLDRLAGRGFTGAVAVEVSTRRARGRAEREADLAAALAFARQHLKTPAAGSEDRGEVGGGRGVGREGVGGDGSGPGPGPGGRGGVGGSSAGGALTGPVSRDV